MAQKLKSVDELFKDLGVKERANIEFSMWQPWEDDEAPQAFKGIYRGYKIAEKALGERINQFDIFLFDEVSPAPVDGASGYAVGSSFMLDNLKFVKPGTVVAIGYTGSEGNNHGGKTHNLAWSFLNKEDRKSRVSQDILPAHNAEQYELSQRQLADASTVS